MKAADCGDESRVFGVSHSESSTQTELFADVDFRSSNHWLDIVLAQDGTRYWQIETDANSLNPYIGEWVHVAIIQDGTSPKMYFNGVEQHLNYMTSTDTTKWFKAILTDAGTKANTATIGSLVRYGQIYGFTGAIDEFRIYNRSLSADEIAMTYYSEFQRYGSGQYRFYANMTNLTQADYAYQGIARDEAGNLGYTDGGALRHVSTLAEVIDILVTPAAFDFGPLNPNTNITSDTSINVTNTPNSNVPINVSINGTDFTGGPNSIGIGNMTMRASGSKPDSSYFTADNMIRADEALCSALLYSLDESCYGMPVGSTVHLWFNLNVPGGQPAGAYSSTVSINAMRAS
ncbi:Concanavalin A-like lectin/glucanases superfamily protein [uncultured archaeon]|nr:Concanavalin A-like lectin/glucanases superfamily protein [uncultured archaeon]